VPERARVQAAVVVAPAAEPARAARAVEAAEHAVAGGQQLHAVADGRDRPDVLVPDREAGLDLDTPVVDVQIRAAHAGRLDPHDGIAGLQRLGLGALLDGHDPGRLEGDRAHRRPAYPTLAAAPPAAACR